ncbi:MAG: response regulator transcription factor, partial [Syntrophobacteraceae bacterium]
EVFQMIAEGRSTREIADVLCISASTVKTHRSNIMEKLQMETVFQLVHFAFELGLVEVQS